MAATYTCPKCQTVVQAAGAGPRRCPKCGPLDPTLGGDKSLLAKLEEEGIQTAALTKKPAKAEGKKSSEWVKVVVGVLGASVGLTAAAIALVAVLTRNAAPAGSSEPPIRGQGLTDSFPIKLKIYPAPGVAMRRHQVNQQTQLRRFTDGAGKVVQEDKLTMSYEVDFTEVILEPGDKQPRRFQRTYHRATEKMGDQVKTHSYVNRTVVFELVGGQYEASAVGEPSLPVRDLAELTKRVSRQDQVDALLPQGMVKLGQPWPINLAAYTRMIADGAEVDLNRSTGQARLSEVRDRNSGQRFGVIKLQIKMAVKSIKGKTYDPPAEFEMDGELDTAIDGSSTVGTLTTSGKQVFTGPAADPQGRKLNLETTVQFTGKDERSEEKK